MELGGMEMKMVNQKSANQEEKRQHGKEEDRLKKNGWDVLS